jgi:hypothetical protein
MGTSKDNGERMLPYTVHLRSILSFVWFSLLFAAMANGKVLYVRAGAPSGGDGSESAPFNSLATIEKASVPGDEIVVVPSPRSTLPLDGGIALKPHQRLVGQGAPVTGGKALVDSPRITNTNPTTNSGDAVVLADEVEVMNLVIENAYRGGIFGANVSGVKIHGNNLSATNTSCTVGFSVYFPGNVPLLPNGWAAIMADEDKGTETLFIQSNEIHDGSCNDGIDIRATGDAHVTARIDGNQITRLAQGPKFRSLLAIGLQTRDSAVLTVESNHNTETYIGSPNADCEGLFSNQTGGSITWNINYNTFAHGIGGRSCNGAEFYIGSGAATANLYISHSTFEDDPGDMLQEVNAGTGSTMNLTLEDVTVRHTTFAHLPPEPKFTSGVSLDDNVGRCMDQNSWGHENVNNFRMLNSHFFDCEGDGIGSIVTGAVLTLPANFDGPKTMNFGDGAGNALSIDIENSTISGSRQYAMHFTNHAAMGDLAIRVRNSTLEGAQGPAILAVDQDASTTRSDIDLGNADSPGNNCVKNASNLLAEISGYNVSAEYNWWGNARGPAPKDISVTFAELSFDPWLRQQTSGCKRMMGPNRHTKTSAR